MLIWIYSDLFQEILAKDFVTRIWLDNEKKASVNKAKENEKKLSDNILTGFEGSKKEKDSIRIFT